MRTLMPKLMPRLMIVLLLLAGQLAGCNKSWSPDEDRSVYKSSYRLTPDGHYRVRSGDTLHAIAFNFGMDWREIAAWNNIRSPYTIFPDQELRLAPPGGRGSSKKSSGTTASAGSKTAAETTAGNSSSGGAVVRAAPPKTASTTRYEDSSRTASATASSADDPAKWLWPVQGRTISNFKANDPARKGIDIGGKEGQPVIASAAGEVVYSGSGLIGYGELIIIKHNDRMLSAYAHNRKRLVSEGQRVTAGESIAEMGRNDRNQAMLHFEIRLNGTPQNPLNYLPGR